MLQDEGYTNGMYIQDSLDLALPSLFRAACLDASIRLSRFLPDPIDRFDLVNTEGSHLANGRLLTTFAHQPPQSPITSIFNPNLGDQVMAVDVSNRRTPPLSTR